jgi:hypothetical protein
METRLSPEAKCNRCGYPIDTATGITGRIPDPGDLSVCIACGMPEMFIMCPTGMITRPCTEEELTQVLTDDVAVKLIAIIAVKSATDPDWPKGPRE